MRYLFVLFLVSGMVGCGTAPSPKPVASSAKPKAKTTATTPVRASPPPTVAADRFASLPDAIEAMQKAAVAGDSEASIQVEKWLVMQGGASVAPLSALVSDEQAHLAHRIAAARVLRKLGPPAKPALLAALGSSSQQMQLNAIKGLSLIRPTDADIIQRLDSLLSNAELRVRQEAILGLANIGEPAGEHCTEHLLAILNNAQENETLRDAAKIALTKVNPRRKLVD
jgi:hypothetical protein